MLTLDSSRSRSELGWRNHLSLSEAIRWTVDWQKAVDGGNSCIETTLDQLNNYHCKAVAETTVITPAPEHRNGTGTNRRDRRLIECG